MVEARVMAECVMTRPLDEHGETNIEGKKTSSEMPSCASLASW